MAVVSPHEPDGPQRLAAAGAGRVLVLGAAQAPSPGVEVWTGPFATPLQLPLRDGSVDALLCIEAYADLSPEDRAALVREARRVLRTTGVLVVWSADLPGTEALLRASFAEVAALAQLPWSGFRLAPVGASATADVRLVEDLWTETPPPGPYLVLASATELGPLVQECVLVATKLAAAPAAASPELVAPAAASPGPDTPAESPAEAPASPAARPVLAVIPAATITSVIEPVPPLGPLDESDVLAALFDATPEPAQPEPSPPGATKQEPAIDPEELAELREHAERLRRERDGLRERAAMLTQELRHAHAQAIDAGAELHELRRRVDTQRANEDEPAPMLDAVQRDDPAALTRVLVDEAPALVTPEAQRPTADVVLDRDRLREELTRRTTDLQALETRLWQSEEEVQRERLENVRLVTDVDRLREQVDRSRIVEHERMQELERLGHELRRLELAYAELQGLYTTGDHRLRELEESMERGDDPPELVELEAQVRDLKGERDQAQALERAAIDQARRRDRELAEAARTIRELRRSVEEHASVAANLRGELTVMQVEVEQFGAAVPGLQERLRDHQRKILEREEEAAELQRRLEESVAEQQELRQRLRRYKQDLEAVTNAKETIEQDLDRLRGEVDAKRRSVEQLQQLVALGAGTGRGTADDHELQALRALLAQQTSEHAERLAQQEQQQRLLNEHQREKLARVQLEASIRAEEQEYLLYQLDTAEQRIWEMTDATDRSAARLAAGLAQLDKQKEQYEDLIDQLEVARTLLAEAQDQIVELERQMASDKAKLARLTLEPGVRVEVEDDEAADGSAFDVLVVDHAEDDDEDDDMEVAPRLQIDPDRPDPLAGIDFDDDEESMAVRLANPFQLTGAFAAATGVRVSHDHHEMDEMDARNDRDEKRPKMVFPSDRLHIDLDDDEPMTEPPRRAPPPKPAPQPTAKLLRALPFLSDDDDMFSIDTDSIEIATPTPTPPPPDRPGFDQKLTDHSNSRIVIEILDDEAWPEDPDDDD